MADKGDVKKFDEGMAELEAIVTRLERGDLPLEEALAAFESGIALVRTLTERLNEAEARVEVLTGTANGTPQFRPLAAEQDTKDRKE